MIRADQNTLEIPSFTLYPISTQDLKTCYESASYKIICTLTGPYYNKKLTQLQPYFNIAVANSSHPLTATIFTAQQLNKFQRKLQEVLNIMVVRDRYQRMIFDINMEIIEYNQFNPKPFILSPLINLLCYTCTLKCLQIYSIFTCSAAVLSQDKIVWQYQNQTIPQIADKYLVMCSDQRDKKVLLIQFQGQFNYIHYQKLSSALQQANDQLAKFQQEKALEVYDIFHQ